MDERIAKLLNSETPPAFHRQMLDDSRQLVDMSRRKMNQYYARWDEADRIYRGIQQPDEEDTRAIRRGEPQKFVVPITYSQVQTFVAFAMNVYLQRDRFFELLPVNEQAARAALIAEAVLQRDLIKSQFESRLYQFLLDVARFGLGVLKTIWVHETEYEEIPLREQGVQYGVAHKPVTRYMGNRILNVSPYSFFPDPRLPLCRFQEGEFVASEETYTLTELRRMERDGLVAGIKHIPPFQHIPRDRRAFDLDWFVGGQSRGTVLVTEVQRSIIPAEYEVDGKPLGTEEWPVKYVIWYANDARVIKCEPLVTGHGRFTYDLAEYNPDQHHLLGDSLADSIDMLQRVTSWFINSRITSVRKVISNRLVVDPSGVEMKDLQERSPVIRLKPEALGRGVDRYIKQLEVLDVTANHLNDARYLTDLVRLTTGISENLQGQFYRGRRTAEEARAVTGAAMGRLKSLLTIIFNRALEPMGRKMLANLRRGLTEETLVRVVGPVEGVQFFRVTRDDLEGEYDFEVFDGTLPSEKGMTAMALQDLLLGLMAKPEVSVAFGIDPKRILLEILELRGVRNPQRFFLNAPRGPAPTVGGMAAIPPPAPVPGAPEAPEHPLPTGLAGVAEPDVVT